MEKHLTHFDQTAFAAAAKAKLGLMRGPVFDGLFIFAPLLLCLWVYHQTLIKVTEPATWLIAIYASYFSTGHAMSTFSRVLWNKDSLKRYHWLLIATPAVIATLLYFLINAYGIAFMMTTYFVLQWFHYVRQGYGLSQVYRHLNKIADPNWLHQSVIYSLPVWGVLHRMTTADQTYLYSPIYTLPKLDILVWPAMGFSLVVIALWLLRRARDIWQGKPVWGYTLFVLSHLVVFYLAFIYIDDATLGWLGSAFWHATQYLFFVWHYNRRQAETAGGFSNWFQYVAISTIVFVPAFLYFGDFMTNSWAWVQQNLQLAATTGIALNLAFLYNHYLADAILWRSQKPKGK